MWRGPEQDPGGGSESGPPTSSQELSDLKDQYEQQQVLIAQLKEMIRKNEQSNVTTEKVEEYMNTLTKMNARVKKGKSGPAAKDSGNKKINLLRQQLEENKAKLAERDKSQKGIEEMVTQLKAQLDDSQQLINQSPLNVSHTEAHKIDYSPQNSSEELYNILLSKDRHVGELLEKVNKLESNVLDLQENLKEKDSVIDARTKAITLMSESLSKKSKTSLDQLDETKDQMRKMQENFVTLEIEMKARQSKLLDDLKAKNYEIAELQEMLEAEKSKSNEPTAELGELKAQVDQLLKENRTLKDSLEENEEVGKLKKQLDDSNKNMIKVKAQLKSKEKEFKKKIESFKKVSDANAEIVKLEAENCRLNQKIAELEEEKGSMQLKMVESDSSRGSEPTEREKELESRLLEFAKTLEEKDEAIMSLESEIASSKTEIETLSEKLKNLAHLQNAQVTSEITSIHFEEQMDALENEKKQLLLEQQNDRQEKDELTDQIEALKKEKQELSSKLESYIQENMELVDKLEKLSAEKVSSAESIEIVEGLTHQEKLELEAYQKSLETGGNLKSSEENLPQNVDESVHELTEEMSELLQKIELFTVERREVMEKMEQLKLENNNLSLKIKEIENNRDVLAETYEQLQTEKEALDLKMEQVQTENDELKKTPAASPSDESGSEKELDRVKEYVAELEGDLETYKNLIEDGKREVEKLSGNIKELEDKLEEQIKENIQLNDALMERVRENEALNENTSKSLSNLENECSMLLSQVRELEEHKANLTHLVEKNQEDYEAVSNTEWEHQRLLEVKDDEINKLLKERDNLQEAIKEKDENFRRVSQDLKEKYLAMQKKLECNTGNIEEIKGPLEAKVEELTQKNKEQLDKMKKIAANLKKKMHAYQELEANFKDSKEKWELELSEKDMKCNESEKKVTNALEQIQELESELRNLRDLLNQKTQEQEALSSDFQRFKQEKADEIALLESKNVELQNAIRAKANEMSLQQELKLKQENLEGAQVEASLHSKIQELEMIVETQESELTKYKERVNKLEEGLSFVEKRRMSLERRANDLGAQLEERSINCEELSQSSGMLEERLAALIAQDELIEKKLESTLLENQDLNEQNKKLNEKNEKLKKKAQQALEKVKSMEGYESFVEDLERQNSRLKQQVGELEAVRVNYENTIEQYKNELDKLNSDWQAQFDQIFNDRQDLSVMCEKLREELEETKSRDFDQDVEIGNLRKTVEDLQLQHASCSRDLNVVEEEKQQLTEQLGKVMYDLQVTKGNLNVSLEEAAEVKKHLENVKEDFLKKTAEKTVTSIITQAEEHVTPTTEVPPTLVWGETVDDPFDFVSQTPQMQELPQAEKQPEKELTRQESTDENSREELLSKIKTLEFMLYSVEKEKDDALLQCHEMSNELTRLVYDRENPKALESQILSNIPDFIPTDLQKIEYASSNPPVVSSIESGAVSEEVVQPKQAYLCFNPDSIDSQILPSVPNAIREELQQVEFTPTFGGGPSGVPVQEQVEARSAYVCEPSNRDTFGENDDGWGWGPEESRLEEEHRTGTENLQERIRVLEMERENHLEEIKQLQIKSGKLIKKLKELKAKNEQLSKKDDDFFSLDNAIQEELKIQIEQVEKKLKETIAELEKEKAEKASILKRIDVLTSANERMVEMKEKQDVELLGWQRNCRELQAKLERFEWGDDGFVESPVKKSEKRTPEKVGNEDVADLTAKINELNEKIKELTLDNEELLALLEEQQKLRVAAEKAIKSIPEDVKTEAEYTKVLEEKNHLAETLKLTAEEKKLLQDKVNELIKSNDELAVKFKEIEKEKLETAGLSSSKDVIIDKLNATVQLMETARRSTEHRKDKDDVETKIEFADYNQSIDSLTLERDQIFKELHEKNARVLAKKAELEAEIEQLTTELGDQTRIAADFLQANETLSGTVSTVQAELAAKEAECEAKELELQQAKLELERKEVETTQLIQVKQIELEEKDVELRQLIAEGKQQEVLELQQQLAQIQSALEGKDLELIQLNQELQQAKLELGKKEVEQPRHLELEQKGSDLRQLFEAPASSGQQQEVLELQKQLARIKSALEEKDLELTQFSQTKDLEVTQLNQEWEARVDERGNVVAESWKLHLETRETEFGEIEALLRKEINELEEKCNALVNENNELRKNVDAEIRNEVDKIAALQQQISDRQQYINDLTRSLQDKQHEFDQIQQELFMKSSELGRLQQEAEEAHVHYDLVQKQLEVESRTLNSIIEMLSEHSNETVTYVSVVESLQVQLEKIEKLEAELILLEQQQGGSEEEHLKVIAEKVEQVQSLQRSNEEKDLTISQLTNQIQEIQSLKEYENENIVNLQQNIIECQRINSSLDSQLQEKSARLEELVNVHQNCQSYLQERESEVTSLKSLIEEKEREHAYALDNITLETRTSLVEQSQEIEMLKRRLQETENRYEEAIGLKVSEIESLQFQLQAFHDQFSGYSNEFQAKNKEVEELVLRLNEKTQECSSLEAKIKDQEVLLENDNKHVTELRAIIEEQVLKIEDLKQDLYEKSNDYDSLIAEMDIGRTTKSEEPKSEARASIKEEDLSDPVCRAELDLALYMLHQRDVRCEELTVELTQLLEERDTLQLRLSNAIREKEDIGRRYRGDTSVEASGKGVVPKSPQDEAADAAEAEGTGRLANKLFELKNVGYKNDKTIVDQQELRRLQELSIMQQHIDVASKLPPEAAARLVDASYTLSRDVQSPSKVLLNWLWGRSTPKVNNI